MRIVRQERIRDRWVTVNGWAPGVSGVFEWTDLTISIEFDPDVGYWSFSVHDCHDVRVLMREGTTDLRSLVDYVERLTWVDLREHYQWMIRARNDGWTMFAFDVVDR